MDEYTNTKVKELSPKNYKIDNKVIIMNNKKPGLVVFYNHWCGYCKMVKPEFIKLTKNKKYNFYAVHGENPLNKEIFQYFLIQGVPQIRYVHKNGKIGDIFNGERNAQGMLQALKQKEQKGGNCMKHQINNLYREYDELDTKYEDEEDEERKDELADERDEKYEEMSQLIKKYLKSGKKYKDLEVSSNWKEKDFKGGKKKRKQELKKLTKPVLLKKIRKYEKKENKKAKINMNHKKEVMIKYIDKNIKH